MSIKSFLSQFSGLRADLNGIAEGLKLQRAVVAELDRQVIVAQKSFDEIQNQAKTLSGQNDNAAAAIKVVAHNAGVQLQQFVKDAQREMKAPFDIKNWPQDIRAPLLAQAFLDAETIRGHAQEEARSIRQEAYDEAIARLTTAMFAIVKPNA